MYKKQYGMWYWQPMWYLSSQIPLHRRIFLLRKVDLLCVWYIRRLRGRTFGPMADRTRYQEVRPFFRIYASWNSAFPEHEKSGLRRSFQKTAPYAAIFFIPFVDETLQLFTEGRSGQISDVWLDMSGAVTGTILYACICFLISGKAEKREKNKAGVQNKWKKRT